MKNVLRLGVIFLLPILILYHFIKTKIFKKFSVTALIFHDVQKEDFYKFARIIKHLHKKFNFITPEEFDDYMHGKLTLNNHSILITFDDGFYSSKEVTDKFLAPIGIKALFFCCPTFIGMDPLEATKFVNNNLYLREDVAAEITDAKLPMNEKQISDLISNGHSIGGHTVSHKKLSKLKDGMSRLTEIADCKSALEKQFSIKASTFAYPFGGIDSIDNESVKIINSNFKHCFSGIRGNITPRLMGTPLPRQCITLQNTYLQQLAIFYGATSIYHIFKRKKLIEMSI